MLTPKCWAELLCWKLWLRMDWPSALLQTSCAQMVASFWKSPAVQFSVILTVFTTIMIVDYSVRNKVCVFWPVDRVYTLSTENIFQRQSLSVLYTALFGTQWPLALTLRPHRHGVQWGGRAPPSRCGCAASGSGLHSRRGARTLPMLPASRDRGMK